MNWQNFAKRQKLADRNYRLGAIPLTLYVEAQKQYIELVSAVSDLQKDALQAAQEMEILTGLKALPRRGETMIDKILEFLSGSAFSF